MVPVVVACVDWWELVSLHWSLHWTWDWFHNTLYTLIIRLLYKYLLFERSRIQYWKRKIKRSLEKSVLKNYQKYGKVKGHICFVLWPINFCLLQFCSLQFWDAQILVLYNCELFLIARKFLWPKSLEFIICLYYVINYLLFSCQRCQIIIVTNIVKYDKSSLLWY